MGCQCANKEEESKSELLRKEQNLENEEFPEAFNNSNHRDGIFDLANQEMENQAEIGGENNEKEAEQEQDQEQRQNYH